MTEEELRAREEAVAKVARAGRKKAKPLTPKQKEAVERLKATREKAKIHRYCKLFYSDMLTLEEVAKLLECSPPYAMYVIRDTYFEITDINKNQDRKDMEFRYADIYNKLHGK